MGVQSPRAVGQFFSSGCRAEPSEDAEIFDSDDDGLLSLSKILVRSKQVIEGMMTMVMATTRVLSR